VKTEGRSSFILLFRKCGLPLLSWFACHIL